MLNNNLINKTDKDSYSEYYLAFSHFRKFGPASFRLLETGFNSIKQAYYASGLELERAGIKPLIAREFIKWRQSPEASFARIKESLNQAGISFTTWNDSDYPALLKQIAAPPPVLYYRGLINDQEKNRLAIVGSRMHTAYGEKVIKKLLPNIVGAGITVVSGLALGIDSAAHRQTLESAGVTWAVLGSGLDQQNIYPAANHCLADDIIKQGGAVISEFPPGTPPLKQNFPQRNRIIAGLCQATLVIESKIKSGALITAGYALENNRDVLAIPGNIFSEFSDGPNKLIQSGAKTVTTAGDILEAYNMKVVVKIDKSIDEIAALLKNKAESVIYAIIKTASERAEKISADEIFQLSELDSSVINSTLSMLELRGIIKNSYSGYDLN